MFPPYYYDLIKVSHGVKESGLFLVVAPTGAGKTTTLAAFLEEISMTQSRNIITLEDPIEYVFSSGDKHKSIISQREIHKHTKSFTTGIAAAKRQDPDDIVVGEMRSTEAIEATLDAAESGHRVFSTLHTSNVFDAIDRTISVFLGDKQNIMRFIFSRVVKVIISQRLILSGKTNNLYAVPQVLMPDDKDRELIRDWKLEKLKERSISRIGNPNSSYHSPEEHLIHLYKKGAISKPEMFSFGEAEIIHKLLGTRF